MNDQLTIGAVSRETGVPAKTIRFYEAEGALPAPPRTAAGYRVYSPIDVRRLRLLRNARMLGLSVAEAKELVEQAFASDCRTFAPQLVERIAARRAGVRRRITELRTLHRELVEFERHIAHAECASIAGQRVADCTYCPLIDEEGTSRHEEV